MSIEESIKVLEQERACVARQGEDGCDRDCARCDLVMDDKVILQAYDAAISLLRTHQDAQPNEPLRWRSCKKEKPTETGWYEVVQTRLSGAKARVTIAMYDPRYYDGDGWGYMNITQWRPLPDPPKEDEKGA